jgi:hypothetical protein
MNVVEVEVADVGEQHRPRAAAVGGLVDGPGVLACVDANRDANHDTNRSTMP